MAVDTGVSPHELGRSLAELIGSEPIVRRLSVSFRESTFEVWLLTEPFEGLEPMRRLHSTAGPLYQHFREQRIEMHILNPTFYPGVDVASLIPKEAQEISLPRG